MRQRCFILPKLARRYAVFGIALMALTLAGCVTQRPPNLEQEALVVGYLDMNDSPANLDFVQLQLIDPIPADGGVYYSCGVKDGIFSNGYLQPGTYRLTRFAGQGKIPLITSGTRYEFAFPKQGKGAMDPVVKTVGSVVFVGSFKYVDVKTGLFEGAKFKIESTPTPTEREILTKLLPELSDSPWKIIVQKRLEELK